MSCLVCSCKFKSLKLSKQKDGNQEETKIETKESISSSLDDSFSAKSSEEQKEPLNQDSPTNSDKKSDSKEFMSPFFNHNDEPYQLSEEEQALLLLPTDTMFTKLFKDCNSYIATSKFLGKMYAHISWANREFSHTYVNLLGQFIQDAEHHEIKKKFKTPLLQLLLLDDIEGNVQLRAKIAMKNLFSQLFLTVKDKYYVLALEIFHLICHLISNAPSIRNLALKHQDLLKAELIEFATKDPFVCLNQMQWLPNLPRTAAAIDLNNRLLESSIEDMIKLNLMDKHNKLECLFDKDNEQEFMTIEETMLPILYRSGDELYFFSEKYKDWIHSYVVQNIGDEVIYIECKLSSKEKTTPIFVFKEVLESLDKEIFGETIQEIETSAYFHRLFKLIT